MGSIPEEPDYLSNEAPVGRKETTTPPNTPDASAIRRKPSTPPNTPDASAIRRKPSTLPNTPDASWDFSLQQLSASLSKICQSPCSPKGGMSFKDFMDGNFQSHVSMKLIQ